ncbi:hypothetical protein E2C01_011881 [Portunus trituberculatus]|uniref:Uncharacterized protein n=1 Tax=Portunus trituberculatus TaxID=210409 RepID=A0A5B7DCD5_PORTR|nr:hypothetical protein [Portunus trituberculatus]
MSYQINLFTCLTRTVHVSLAVSPMPRSQTADAKRPGNLSTYVSCSGGSSGKSRNSTSKYKRINSHAVCHHFSTSW